jgi:hypothetical protein
MINNEHIQNEAILQQQHQHQDNKQVSSSLKKNLTKKIILTIPYGRIRNLQKKCL